MGPAAAAAVAGAPATAAGSALLLAGERRGAGAGTRHAHALAGPRPALGGGLPPPDADEPGTGRCERRLAGLRHPPGAPGRGVARPALGGDRGPGGPD